jgi:hypothetical protein
MPIRSRKKKSQRSRGPINDISHNSSNITINFRKVLPLSLVPTGGGATTTFRAVRLSPGIAEITTDLALIYKLYRFTEVHFTFQAEISAYNLQNFESSLALNYIPAQESIAGSPGQFEEFEGPAVGFYSNTRGMPYTYRTPSKILNAMPYNWYETKGAEASDLTQGVYYFLSDVPTQHVVNIFAHFTCEFQTLEDPAFLAALQPDRASLQTPYLGKVRKKTVEEPEEQFTNVIRAESIYDGRRGERL